MFVSQGRHTSQDEMTACAFQAVTVDQQYDNQPVQVRVTMGKEPRHFMAVFKGRMVVYEVLIIHTHFLLVKNKQTNSLWLCLLLTL